MQWFYNMKIGKKLIMSFLLIAGVAGFIGWMGYRGISDVKINQDAIYNDKLLPILDLDEANVAILTLSKEIWQTVITKDPVRKESLGKDIEKNTAEFNRIIGEHSKLNLSKEEQDLLKKFQDTWKRYQELNSVILSHAMKSEDADALRILNGEMVTVNAQTLQQFMEIIDINGKFAEELDKDTDKDATAAMRMMIILTIVGVVLAFGLGIFIARIIGKPVNALVSAADKLAIGNVNVNVEATSTDEIGDLMRSFGKMVENIQENAEHAQAIAKGDLSIEVTPKSADDALALSMKKVVESLRALVAEAGMLTKAAVEGKLDTRGNAEKFQGAYRDIVKGVNDTLDAVIGPLNVAAEYVDRISKGDIPPKISDTYHGDFNEIKNNLNRCIDAVNALAADATMLAKAAVEGKLDTRADASKHEGDFRKIVQGVNDTLNAVIGPLNVAAEYVDRISKGDIPPKITDNYNGDFNEIKNNLNQCIDAVKALVADANALSEAAVEGRLATRADATKHEGDFRRIVQGVNDTLDAVIQPVNEAVEVISEMADGDLTVKVSGEYRGDHAKMKDALNRTLEALNEILGQVNTAAEQVVSGAEQVSDSSQSLSQGATEQASSLEEITSSMTEMTSQTKQNAENAQQANKLAAAARDNAEQGNSRMGQMLAAMGEINESSGQISKIIKVIDEIAFQTNLLALNAAVEAARAGVHGKGFAVVADEVRNLAQRSAKAAKETTELIETSIKKVENGTGIANETAKALNEIVSGVTKVTDLVGEIASASNEQAQGIGQVNQGLGQIDRVTQANTANSEESAAAAEELSGQASQLKQMLTRFRVNGSAEIREYRQPARIESGGNGGNGGKHAVKRLAESKGSRARKTPVQESGAPVAVIALDDEDFGKF